MLTAQSPSYEYQVGGLIRAMYNKRAQKSTYKRLTFALLGVATPPDLIADKNRTPFNIGRAIELKGFEVQEAMPLLGGLKEIATQPEALLTEILHWTGGQPFLTQKLCRLVVEATDKGIMPNPKSYSPTPSSYEFRLSREGQNLKFIEQLVYERIISNWEAQDEPEHLRTIRDRILSNSQRAARLLGIYQQIFQAGEVTSDDSPEQMELLLSGLVEKQQGFLKVKNPIYQNVFDLAWVEEQLGSLRPYTQAFDAWVASKQQDASRLLRGQALRDAQSWAQGKSLSDLDYQFLAASQELDRLEVQQTLEAARLTEVEARLAEERKRLVLERETAKRQRRFIRALSGVLMVAIAFGLLALWQYHRAVTSEQRTRISEIQALTSSSAGQFASQQGLDGLVSAIKARRRLDSLANSSPQLQSQVQQVLQQAIYGTAEFNRLSGHPSAVLALDVWKFDGTLLKTIKKHDVGVWDVSPSPDGQRLASASDDKTVKLWNKGDILTKAPVLRTFKGHQARVYDVDFTPDGKQLVSVSADGTARLWSLDGRFSKTLKGHGSGVWEVAISPDGGTFATASMDDTIKLWTSDGTLLKTLKGNTRGMMAVDFSPDGQILVAGGSTGALKLWKTDGTEITTLTGHEGNVWGVAFSPDGKQIASVGDDRTIILWDVERILKLDELAYACDLRFAAALRYRVRNYLRTNADMEKSDSLRDSWTSSRNALASRSICDGVGRGL